MTRDWRGLSSAERNSWPFEEATRGARTEDLDLPKAPTTRAVACSDCRRPGHSIRPARDTEETDAMKIDLTNKRAVASGSTSGIGFAIAKGARRGRCRGHHQWPKEEKNAGRREEACLVERVQRAAIAGVAADLATRRRASPHFIEGVPETDILVNNVGIFDPKPFEAIADDDWQRFFEVNVMSGVRLSRPYLPAMVEPGWAASSSSPASWPAISRRNGPLRCDQGGPARAFRAASRSRPPAPASP